MNSCSDEVVTAPADPPQPLDWKFSQVFGERAAGEEVQEGFVFVFWIYLGSWVFKQLWLSFMACQ
ncbi:hypothetical protein SLEP1_g43953 [Rubroshorea leprosula]|uniref:Uncharacterized protein n=1 Tax=Rubroshorea leprosula TaxID=152421 RepID=A0AAV5LFS4_9ROSI|nr:hypothetical protein SLEP1_g43953 [Rubroshorea leprosula]